MAVLHFFSSKFPSNIYSILFEYTPPPLQCRNSYCFDNAKMYFYVFLLFSKSKLPHNGVEWDTNESWKLEAPKNKQIDVLLETWGHGVMESWSHGVMESWSRGVMESWIERIQEIRSEKVKCQCQFKYFDLKLNFQKCSKHQSCQI